MSKPEDKLSESMHVITKSTCDSVSSKSKITYHVGATPDNEIHFRIHSNTGGGFMSTEWVSLKDILDVFGEVPKGQPITSFVLQPLFRGKSVNTPAFLVAALANEKLLQLLKGKKRGHIVMDPEGFIARMEKLMTSTVKKKTPRKKAATKKTSIPRGSARKQ
ncbi:hypothetical protein ACFL3A_04530 [Pseudomonadota bacterium]